ncbi:pectinesterase inhibitor 9-like [Curcuma longa]|uniref:pectinesterase inhibitor 9-like n=1 Tax=Curcuma longa TaxID=136217 RepID=UPI003D9F38D6
MGRHALAFLLLLLSALAIAGGVASSTAEFVRDACRRTRYPDLCEQCLAAYAPAGHRSKLALARAALSVSADRAGAASAFVGRMSVSAAAGGSRKSLEAGAVRDCIETLRDGVDWLRQSVKEMAAMTGVAGSRRSRFAWHLSNVQTWVSAALTDETTCLDGLAQFAGPSVRTAVRKKVVEVAQVTSNALALVNQLGPKN